MSVTIIPVPVYDRVRVRDLQVGDWIGDLDGRWHFVREVGDTCLLLGEIRADSYVVDVRDPDGFVYRIDPADVPRRY